jgi:hypothetical protein
MKQFLRKTPSSLLLAYRYGDMRDTVVGRNFLLETPEEALTLSIDLSTNFHARNREAASYSDAVNLVHNHHRLQFLQCGDNLLRARLARCWDRGDPSGTAVAAGTRRSRQLSVPGRRPLAVYRRPSARRAR